MEDLVTKRIILHYLDSDHIVMLYFVSKSIRLTLRNRKTINYIYQTHVYGRFCVPLDLTACPLDFMSQIWRRSYYLNHIHTSPIIDNYLYNIILKSIKTKDYDTIIGCFAFGCNAGVDIMLANKDDDELSDVVLDNIITERDDGLVAADIISSVRRGQHLDLCVEYLDDIADRSESLLDEMMRMITDINDIDLMIKVCDLLDKAKYDYQYE